MATSDIVVRVKVSRNNLYCLFHLALIGLDMNFRVRWRLVWGRYSSEI